MKVLIVFSSSQLGGAERSLTRMAAASKTLGNDVEYQLCTLDGSGPWVEWSRSLALNPITFGKGERAKHGQFGLSEILSLVKHIRSQKFEVVYVVGLRASIALRFLKWSFKWAKLVHGVRWNPDSDTKLDNAFRWIERWFGGLIDFYIVNSRIASHTLMGRCRTAPKKIEVIYNGIDQLPQDLAPLHQRPMQIITIANLSPRKGHIEYLEVIQKVLQRIPEAQFLFVGRDDMAGRVQQAIERANLAKKVRCLGFQEDVGPLLRESRLMVLPSLWGEGCPTSILESMAFEVPVVAFGIDGVPELIQNGVDGILVPSGNKEKMTEAIISMLTDDLGAQRSGHQGREKVNKEFSIEKSAYKHLSAFSTLKQKTGQN